MTRREQLKKHMDTLNEKKSILMKANEDYIAHEKSFMAWLSAELGIGKGGQLLLPEILTKWDELNDITSKS